MAAAVVLKETLEVQLEEAKECLKDVDENIKKLTGRDPNELRSGMRRGPMGGGLEGRGRERITMMGNRRDSGGMMMMMDGPPGNKRRALGGPFNRLGPRVEPRRNRGEDSGEDDDLPHKPTLQSSIVATPKEIKSRKDCLEEQKQDSKGLARNRRMFGLLLGTLQKFKDEETVKKEKEMKRLEIEKKLEAAAEKEKEDLKKERNELFNERRRRQSNLRKLQEKMDIVKQHGKWEAHHKNLLFYIQTKTKPSIFYLPAKHTLVTEERLKESRKRIEGLIAERRAQTEKELQAKDENRVQTSEAHDRSEIEEEAVMKDEEENNVIVEEAEMKEDEEEDESATKENVPETCIDEQIETAVDEIEREEEGQNTKVVPCEDDAENGESVMDTSVKVDEKQESNLDETVKEEEESKSNEAELFAKDQNLLTEKEFEPIYD